MSDNKGMTEDEARAFHGYFVAGLAAFAVLTLTLYGWVRNRSANV